MLHSRVDLVRYRLRNQSFLKKRIDNEAVHDDRKLL